ncbi:MAG: C39 family peptidase [Capsulimonadales bacterium]|nr:C39 family peptidase [Capsulimonadales bacterium]
MNRLFLCGLCLLLFAFPVFARSDAEIAAELEAAARAYRVPSVLLKGLAWKRSRWRQADGQVGILGVPVEGRKDADRLRDDWRYNLREGAKRLAWMFARSPIIGNGRQEDGRNILECWYFALGRYATGRERGPEMEAEADAVLAAIASGGEGRWQPVRITRPSAEKLGWGRGILGPPAPWHFGDVTPLPPVGAKGAEVAVDLPIPYLSQVWDSPDNFDGGGACGPTAMLMILAFHGKLPERPVAIRDSYPHLSRWGGHIPEIQNAVCDPQLGAVHARMLDYLRPFYPKVAIYYDARATLDRVKRELDAGRPVILGTTVTPAGHLIVARGYLADGRLLCNDPAGNYYEAARSGSPAGSWSPTGNRYWNGGGERAVYEWETLGVRWVMTLDGADRESDRAEDEEMRLPPKKG